MSSFTPVATPVKDCRAFTMVEMLAVVAVIAIIVALVVPNGMFAKATGESANMRSYGAVIEMAMGSYLAKYGAQARTAWSGQIDDSVKLDLLQNSGSLPPHISRSQIINDFNTTGYTLVLPGEITGERVIIRRDAEQVYPET